MFVREDFLVIFLMAEPWNFREIFAVDRKWKFPRVFQVNLLLNGNLPSPLLLGLAAR
jgi:hypothetical protein